MAQNSRAKNVYDAITIKNLVCSIFLKYDGWVLGLEIM